MMSAYLTPSVSFGRNEKSCDAVRKFLVVEFAGEYFWRGGYGAGLEARAGLARPDILSGLVLPDAELDGGTSDLNAATREELWSVKFATLILYFDVFSMSFSVF